MKEVLVKIGVGIAIITSLVGCGRIVDWGKSQFYQGEQAAYNAARVRTYIRSIKVYDQMNTIGMFDALWLADAVRTEYAQMHSRKEGRSPDRASAFLRRQLEENRHFISFYLLVPNYIKVGPTVNDDWSVFLDVDGSLFQPIEFKSVELPLEYKVFFCKRYNRFKIVYLVKFDIQDYENLPLIKDDTKSMALCFRSVNKQARLTWLLDRMELVPVLPPPYQRECSEGSLLE